MYSNGSSTYRQLEIYSNHKRELFVEELLPSVLPDRPILKPDKRFRFDPFKIPEDSYVKIVNQSDRYFDLTYQERKTRTPRIIRQGDGCYLNLRTGKVKKFKQSTPLERAEKRQRATLRTYTRLLQTIRVNFKEQSKKQMHIILTFGTDAGASDWSAYEASFSLYKCFDAFYRRFKRVYGDFEYILVPETHQTGLWHLHLLLLSKQTIHLDYKQVATLWEYGSVYITAVRASLMSKYLVKMYHKMQPTYLEPGYIEDIVREHLDAKATSCYLSRPYRMRLYRCSKGIKPPQVYYVPYKDFSQEMTTLGAYIEWSRHYEIHQGVEVINRIVKRSYRLRRL
jgi:hypothetical protein